MQYSAAALDEHAPHLSDLTACGATPVVELPNYAGWLRFQHVVFQLGWPKELQSLVWTYLDRAGSAIDEYNRGVEALRSYVGELPAVHKPRLARQAVTRFEMALLQSQIAVGCLVQVAEIIREKLSEPERSSELIKHSKAHERVRLISNNIKHFDEAVVRVLKRGEPLLRAPMWLTNDGFAAHVAPKERRYPHSFAVAVTFGEAEELLTDLSRNAEFFGERALREVLERQKAKQGRQPDAQN